MSKKLMGLGRGLDSLISMDNIQTSGSSAINEIELSQISPNPEQPRAWFDEESLEELASSIRELGIIQPLTLRKLGADQYQIISGERRYRAAKKAGLTTVPAYIRTANDSELTEMALIENIQREDLNAIEVALTFKKLIDQYRLTQEQLSHAMFPLGSLHKTQVREIAEKHGFINAHKHDSQDICFIQSGTYADFIEARLGRKFPPGNFVDEAGNVLGRHKGIIHYTVGQRKGLGLALPQPMYVKEIDTKANAVILTTNEGLFTRNVTAKNINLIDCDAITEPRRVKARIRYHQQEQWATVTQPDADTLELVFDEPQRAITKGQSVVMYDGDIVVGGGTIV